jgi:radical SAM superfamily enzyme YgiQ (UPF0313 family)
VVAGGGHPTFLSELCMEDAPIDFIIKGEGEESFVDLLNRIRKGGPVDGVDGLVYRDGDAIRANPKVSLIEDLDSIAFPAHDLLDPRRYFKIALPMGYTMMSRETAVAFEASLLSARHTCGANATGHDWPVCFRNWMAVDSSN